MKQVLLTLSLLGLATLLPAQEFTPGQGSSASPLAVSPEKPDKLDKLVERIALFPDVLVATILPASVSSADIPLAAKYLEANRDAPKIDDQPWADSVKALAHYPEAIRLLNDHLEWTAALGRAYAQDPAPVMQAIQQLRARAKADGILVDNAEQKVVMDGDTILIEPIDPDSISVPQYDPDTVFAQDQSGQNSVIYNRTVIFFGPRRFVGPWLRYALDWDDFGVWFGVWHRGWDYRRDWRESRDDRLLGVLWHPNLVGQIERFRFLEEYLAQERLRLTQLEALHGHEPSPVDLAAQLQQIRLLDEYLVKERARLTQEEALHPQPLLQLEPSHQPEPLRPDFASQEQRENAPQLIGRSGFAQSVVVNNNQEPNLAYAETGARPNRPALDANVPEKLGHTPSLNLAPAAAEARRTKPSSSSNSTPPATSGLSDWSSHGYAVLLNSPPQRLFPAANGPGANFDDNLKQEPRANSPRGGATSRSWFAPIWTAPAQYVRVVPLRPATPRPAPAAASEADAAQRHRNS